MANKILITIIFKIFLLISSIISSYAPDNGCELDYVHQMPHSKIIIDTDATPDDIFALVTALEFSGKNEKSEILAITCVRGRTDIQTVSDNILNTLMIINVQVPVYVGAHENLLYKQTNTQYFKSSGIEDFGFLEANLYNTTVRKHAVLALIELVHKYPGEITICTLGPLTNIAMAIKLDPTFRKKVKQIMIFGGSINGYGNILANIEINMYMDPEASFVVFNSTDNDDTSPLMLLPWDTIVRHSNIDMMWRQNAYGRILNERVIFLNQLEQIFESDKMLWNPLNSLLIAITLQPKIVTNASYYHIDVVVQGEFRGGLIVDRTEVMQRYKNTVIFTNVNTEMYKEFMMKWFS